MSYCSKEQHSEERLMVASFHGIIEQLEPASGIVVPSSCFKRVCWYRLVVEVCFANPEASVVMTLCNSVNYSSHPARIHDLVLHLPQ